MTAPIRKLAAIMFADLEGYTYLMQQDESKARQIRQRFEDHVKRFHTSYDGQIIQQMGDGILSIFPSTVQAVQCAISIQKELLKPPAVMLRIGLHSGEIVQEIEGIYGNSVNIAARVESFATGGSILLSESIYQQIRNYPEIRLKDLGLFSFKNIDHPLRLYAVDSEEIVVPSSDQISGKGTPVGKSNMFHFPRQYTKIIGREKEVQEITKLLEIRSLITLTGPGGSGKSRLAIQVAENVSGNFSDGLYWIPLSSIRSYSDLGLELANALSITQNPALDIYDLICDFLKEKKLLLVLDNFEHIIQANQIIQQILDECPGINMIVTSRVILNLNGEQEYPVSPLSLPEDRENAVWSEWAQYSAVKLFYERARMINPRFELNEHNAIDVMKICIKLDGLPLAIELAAARIKLFSPKALLEKLDNYLDLLKSDQINFPERHQTLRNTISWSYDLFSNDDKELFHKLAVFNGGANLEAIRHVCYTDETDEILISEKIIHLANNSLIYTESDIHGESRVKMLSTIRGFALECLKRSGNLEKIRDSHLHFYLSRAEWIGTLKTGTIDSDCLSLLEVDLDNYRDAMEWSLIRIKYDISLKLTLELWPLWISRGMLDEAIQKVQGVLAMDNGKSVLSLKVKVTELLGITYFYTNEYFKSIPLFETCLNYWQQTESPADLARILNHLGFALINSGDFEKGMAMSEDALDMYGYSGGFRGQAVSYNNLGWAYLQLGRPADAIPVLEKAVQLRESAKDQRGMLFSKINLAWGLYSLGRYHDAEPLLQESIQKLKMRNDFIFLWGLIHLAQMKFDQGSFMECEGILEDIKSKGFRNESNLNYAWMKFLNGLLESNKGNFDRAEQLICSGLEIYQKIRMSYFIAKGWYYRSMIYYQENKLSDAMTFLRKSYTIHHEYNCRLGLAENFELSALILIEHRQFENASILLKRSEELRNELTSPTPGFLKEKVHHAIKIIESVRPEHDFKTASDTAPHTDKKDFESLLKLFI